MKRREKNDGLMLKGWNKFFHRLFMIITFPIRRPLIFIPLAAIAYLAPTFMGVKPAEVHLWYWDKIKNHTTNISDTISEKTQAIMPAVDNLNISMPKINNFVPQEKPIEQVVETPQTKPQNVRRQTFEKAKETPGAIDVLKTTRNQAVVQNRPQQPVQSSAPSAAVTEKATDSKKKLPLVFVENEETIAGQSTVHNANEIELYGKTYFLHGIYVNPNSDKGIEAKNFLRNIIAQNIIECKIKAFTYQGIGTVICTVNGENINRLMVERGYSKNVALD